jgi:hypothetical protein
MWPEAMALAKTDASLVLMPLGTANDFAKAAGVPLDPAQALALLDVPPRRSTSARWGKSSSTWPLAVSAARSPLTLPKS